MVIISGVPIFRIFTVVGKYPDLSCFFLSICSDLHIFYMSKIYILLSIDWYFFSEKSLFKLSVEHLNKLHLVLSI